MFRKTFLSLLITMLLLTSGIGNLVAQNTAPQDSTVAQSVIGSAFSYQGQLKNSGGPVNGVCDFEFTLWEAGSSTAELGKQSKTNISVSNGLFTIPDLDFGANAFVSDAERWLGIAVRCPAASGSYTALSPRQRIAPVPYSLFSKTTGSLLNQPLATTVPQTNQVLKWNGTQWSPAPDETGAGGGGSAWLLTGNAGTNPNLNLLGTTDNVSLTLVVSNSAALRLFPNAISPNLVGGSSVNTAAVGVYGATIAGGGDPGNPNSVLGNFGVVGGGHGNKAENSFATVGGGGGNLAIGNDSTVAGGVLNVAGGQRSTVGGGIDNSANGQYATVPGGASNNAAGAYSLAAGQRAKALNNGAFVWADSTDSDLLSTADNQFLVRASGGVVFTSSFGSLLRIIPREEGPNIIGGYTENYVAGNIYGATIGGGGGILYAPDRMRISDKQPNASAGAYVAANRITGTFGTVGGGAGNQAGGMATVGGGADNRADGYNATVSGGVGNVATGTSATISGGAYNQASGYESTVPGGMGNVASGDQSFAAGWYASATHTGAFVWADSSSSDAYYSQRAQQFRIRATGGARFDVNNGRWVEIWDDGLRLINTSTGAHLNVGGGWMNASDRNSKENFAEVNNLQVLERLAQVPISTWNYKAEPESVRHMGPMAQDMYAAFALGDSDKTIGTIDADGVALASIQGLYQVVKEQKATIIALQTKSDQLEARIAALENGSSHGANATSLTTSWMPLALLLVVGSVVGARRQMKHS